MGMKSKEISAFKTGFPIRRFKDAEEAAKAEGCRASAIRDRIYSGKPGRDGWEWYYTPEYALTKKDQQRYRPTMRPEWMR